MVKFKNSEMSVLSTVLLLFVSCVCLVDSTDFKITRLDPPSRNLTVNEGGTFTLKCTANAYIRGCVWRHRDKGKKSLLLAKCVACQLVPV